MEDLKGEIDEIQENVMSVEAYQTDAFEDASSEGNEHLLLLKENTGRWTTEEHQLFLEGLKLHGKGWKKIACLIRTRTVVQIRTHAQKYFQKLAKAKQNGFDGEILMDGRSTFTATSKKVKTSICQTRAGSTRQASAMREQQKWSRRKCDSSKSGEDEDSSVDQDDYDYVDECENDPEQTQHRETLGNSSLKIDSGAVQRVGTVLGTPSPTSVTDACLNSIFHPQSEGCSSLVSDSDIQPAWYHSEPSNDDLILTDDSLSWLADDNLCQADILLSSLDSEGSTDGSSNYDSRSCSEGSTRLQQREPITHLSFMSTLPHFGLSTGDSDYLSMSNKLQEEPDHPTLTRTVMDMNIVPLSHAFEWEPNTVDRLQTTRLPPVLGAFVASRAFKVDKSRTYDSTLLDSLNKTSAKLKQKRPLDSTLSFNRPRKQICVSDDVSRSSPQQQLRLCKSISSRDQTASDSKELEIVKCEKVNAEGFSVSLDEDAFVLGFLDVISS